MKSAVAIKRVMEAEPHGRKCTASELAEFKTSCSSEEYDQLGQQACDVLGETWEPASTRGVIG